MNAPDQVPCGLHFQSWKFDFGNWRFLCNFLDPEFEAVIDWLFVQEMYSTLILACYNKPYYNMFAVIIKFACFDIV